MIIGKASFHRELATNVKNVKGGGWYEFDRERDAFILYAKSEDFGKCSKESVHDAVSRGFVGRYLKDDRYSRYKFYLSSSDKLEDALNNMVELVPYETEKQEEVIVEVEKETVDEQLMRFVDYKSYKPITSNKIGRNEPCPCHSGMKYKKCCLNERA